MPGGLLPGKDKGVTILIGGKGVLKIGATMGTVVIPFMKLETDEDFEKLNELDRNVIDFFAENALEHERTGEMTERIGLTNFLDGLELPVDPNMVVQPRSNPFSHSEDWNVLDGRSLAGVGLLALPLPAPPIVAAHGNGQKI
ncbi:MAG: hypothetical protein ABS92_05290 [Thiobacillus sp. SCN 63-374]|nr:MAG: hypothetical protein ABS92_05290 [Thiobacillus sp. SCN 63-374]